MLRKVLAKFPLLEVWERIIYKNFLQRSHFFMKFVKKIKSHKKKDQNVSECSWEYLASYIDTLGINQGDIVIVHSSMNELKKFGKTCDEIIAYLLALVGKDGTLVMPAFPYFKENHQNEKLMFDEKDEEIRKYDPQRTFSWTGMLPNVMCTYSDAVRSLFPNNSLVAIGKEATAMMEHNLEGICPHGSYSAWDYCAEHNAKVLLLGTSAEKSLTGRHLAEDYLEEKWPIKGWYKVQHYQIRVGDDWIEKDIKVRKLFWSKYVTEYYSIQQLRKVNLIDEMVIEGIQVAYVKNIKAVRDYMISMVEKGNLTFYKIPHKYWKRNEETDLYWIKQQAK